MGSLNYCNRPSIEMHFETDTLDTFSHKSRDLVGQSVGYREEVPLDIRSRNSTAVERTIVVPATITLRLGREVTN